jgi:riboflavin kinase/FMN adenylyltransferase
MESFFLKTSRQNCPLKEDMNPKEGLEEETAVIVGNFDGFHLGHRYLINLLKERSSEKNLKSAVVTFCPHPLKVLAPEIITCELSDIEERIELIGEMNPDYLCFIRFDKEFAKMGAREFLEEIIHGRLRCRHLIVGYDWRFGHRREGEIELAREVGEELGFEVEVAQPFTVDGHIVSSTLIRRLLREGRLSDAKDYLGRDYWIKRKVIRGDGRGRRIGFPTANLEGTENLCLREGVYAVEVDGGMRGVANFGRRPTFGGETRVLEVHIPGFDGDLLGKRLKVTFLRFIREERKFSGAEELKEQIKRDIQSALEA